MKALILVRSVLFLERSECSLFNLQADDRIYAWFIITYLFESALVSYLMVVS